MISFLKIPNQYAPVNNPIMFGISGNSANLVFFKVELREGNTNQLIYTGNIFPTPTNPTVGYFNADKQLSSLVRSDVQLNNNDCYAVGKQKNVVSYNMIATEYGLSAGTMTALGSATTAQSLHKNFGNILETYQGFYAFEQDADILNWLRFSGLSYTIESGTTASARPFLSFQSNADPNFAKTVNQYSVEQLYFLSNHVDIFNVNVTNLNTGLVSAATYNNYSLATPAFAETIASARIQITGTCSAGDNITISGANGYVYGSYTAATTGLSTNQLATNLSVVLTNNLTPLGYNVVTAFNIIQVFAPAGMGATANCSANTMYCVSAGLGALSGASTTGTTTVTAITSTTAVSATAILSGFTAPGSAGITTNITSSDSPFGSITLASYVSRPVDIGFQTVYVQHLVDEINASHIHGYSAATFASSTMVQVIAPVLTSATIYNGTHVNSDDGSFSVTKIFAGGVNLITGTSSTVVVTGSTAKSYFIIPNTVTGFTNGVSAFAGSTGSSYNARIFSIGVSPTAISRTRLSASGGTLWTFPIAIGDTYTVHLTDVAGNQITEKRYYFNQDIDCNMDYVNVLYTNSYGGVDAIQMIAPAQSITTMKQSIAKNNLSSTGTYRDSDNGVLNLLPTNQIYSSNQKATIKCWTPELTDRDSLTLMELVQSKNIYLVTRFNGYLIPVTLVTTNYDVKQKKYIGSTVNQFQFEFELPTNVLPGMARVYVTANSNANL